MKSSQMFESLRQHYYEQPHEVSIETLALCNARCTFCPYGSTGREGVRLSDEVLDTLLNEMALWRRPFYLAPFKVSDPLLDKRMPELCARIEAQIPQAKIRFFTNGAALTEYNRRWLAQLRHLDGLWISLNSCEPREYDRLMGLNYFATERKLDALHAAVVSGAFPHTVTVSRVSQSTLAGQEQLPTDQQNAGLQADYAFRAAVWRHWPAFQARLIKRDGWLGHCVPASAEIPKTPCGRWYELSVTASGVVALCCMDGKNEFPLGQVPEQTLLEIYNQPHLKARRLQAKTREGIEPCARCTY